MTTTGTANLDEWWAHLRAAALVGTARREVPPLPALGIAARDGATREEALLDAAALGDAVRRAGRLPERAPEPDDPAPEETLAVAPSPAVQILELLAAQGPVGGASRGVLTVHWFDTAAAAGRVVPPHLLPQVLDLATTSAVRRAARAVLGERGRWLAARNPEWSWVAEDGPAEQAADRVSAVAELRRTDPDAGRALVEQTWDTDGAQHRAAALAALVIGLDGADEPFLERCLDDRARSVREAACRLLDRLPGSGRAARMADRLRPLLTVHGTLRKHLEVGLPDDPDAAGIRDGLVDPGPGFSKRNRWLQQIVSGAPARCLDRGDSGRAGQGGRDAASRRRPGRDRRADCRHRWTRRHRVGAGPDRRPVRTPGCSRCCLPRSESSICSPGCRRRRSGR